MKYNKEIISKSNNVDINLTPSVQFINDCIYLRKLFSNIIRNSASSFLLPISA